MSKTKKTADEMKVVKDVNITEMVDPKFLSLVGLPANQVAFKVLREDEAVEEVKVKPQRIKRPRRSDNPLIEMAFPDGWDEEGVVEFAKTYGLEEYQISTEDGKYVLRKDGAILPAKFISVTIQKGVKARISRADAGSKERVVLTALEFARDYYIDRSEANDWLNKNNIDITDNLFETSDELHSLQRLEIAENQEVRRMQIDDGVVAVVSRDMSGMDSPDGMDGMPTDYVYVIKDTAYGMWGWGQLDFSAVLADMEFCESANEATCVLNDVVNRILFWSPLTPDQKKSLISNAAAQFTAYVSSLLDALPSQVILANRNDNKKNKEKAMSQDAEKTEAKAEEKQEEVKREDVVEEVKEVVAEVVAAPSFVTREDLEAAMKDFLAKLQEGAVQRSEVKEEAQVKATSDGEKKADEGLAQVLRAVTDLTTLQTTIVERLATLEGQTVVRSDGADGKQTQAKKDPFKGLFGGR